MPGFRATVRAQQIEFAFGRLRYRVESCRVNAFEIEARTAGLPSGMTDRLQRNPQPPPLRLRGAKPDIIKVGFALIESANRERRATRGRAAVHGVSEDGLTRLGREYAQSNLALACSAVLTSRP